MSFIQFLIESRSNPELNIKQSAYSQIEQYKSQPDVYLHFSAIEKLGIKPTREKVYDLKHATPLAIYAYPIKQVWEKYDIDKHKSFKMLPYANKRPFIQVFKYKKPIIDVSKYNNLEHDLNILDERYGHLIHIDFEYLIERSKSKYGPKPFEIFWETTRDIASKLNPDNIEVQWNTILRNLEYNGFTDNEGKGYIHSGESIQTMILQYQDIDVLATILNKDYTNLSTERLAIHNMNDLIAHLNDNASIKSILQSIDGSLAIQFQHYLEELNKNSKLHSIMFDRSNTDCKLLLLAWLNGHVSFKNMTGNLAVLLKDVRDVNGSINYAKRLVKYPWNVSMLKHNLELAASI